MDEETDSSLVSVPVPLDLARGEVDLGVDVTSSSSSYWSLAPSLAPSSLVVGGGVRTQAGVRLGRSRTRDTNPR